MYRKIHHHKLHSTSASYALLEQKTFECSPSLASIYFSFQPLFRFFPLPIGRKSFSTPTPSSLPLPSHLPSIYTSTNTYITDFHDHPLWNISATPTRLNATYRKNDNKTEGTNNSILSSIRMTLAVQKGQ